MDWLLDGDPAIRWQVLRDLADAPAEQVAAERARVETEGWGARLLALRDPDGQWDGGACFPRRIADDWRAGIQPDFSHGQPWTSTLPTLMLLRDLGLDPAVRGRPRDDRAGRGELPVGARRPGVLRRRGRAVHQRPDALDRRLLRCGRRRPRRGSARRPARRRRLELRDRERRHRVVVRLDDLRARGPARVRAGPGERSPWPRRAAAVRSTCWSGSCSGAGAPARCRPSAGCSSRGRRAGTTTSCAPWTTSAAPATPPTRGSPRP